MLIPYHGELFNLIIDLANTAMYSLPKDQFKVISYIIQNHFKNHMTKIVLYNASWAFRVVYKLVTTFYKAKYLVRVSMISKGDEKEFLKFIEPRQWPKKYGGQGPDIENNDFWPPKDFNTEPAMTEQEILDMGHMVFDVVGRSQDHKIFKVEPEKPPLANETPDIPLFMQGEKGKGVLDSVDYGKNFAEPYTR